MDDQKNDHIDPENNPSKELPPKHYWPIKFLPMENTNGTNKGRDLRLVNKL